MYAWQWHGRCTCHNGRYQWKWLTESQKFFFSLHGAKKCIRVALKTYPTKAIATPRDLAIGWWLVIVRVQYDAWDKRCTYWFHLTLECLQFVSIHSMRVKEAREKEWNVKQKTKLQNKMHFSSDGTLLHAFLYVQSCACVSVQMCPMYKVAKFSEP